MFRRPQQPTQDGLTTQRIEAFSDGVFAIAITLLILEVKVPHSDAAAGKRLAEALFALWPSYFTYVLSFVTIGIYWANHHYVFQLYERTNHVFNLLNVLFLMAISFLPLPTAVLGQYVLNPAERQTAIEFYALGLLLPATGWCLMWLYSRYAGLLDCRLEAAFIRRLTIQYVASVVIYGASFATAFVSPKVCLGLSVGLTALYLMRPPTPVYSKFKTA